MKPPRPPSTLGVRSYTVTELSVSFCVSPTCSQDSQSSVHLSWCRLTYPPINKDLESTSQFTKSKCQAIFFGGGCPPFLSKGFPPSHVNIQTCDAWGRVSRAEVQDANILPFGSLSRKRLHSKSLGQLYQRSPSPTEISSTKKSSLKVKTKKQMKDPNMYHRLCDAIVTIWYFWNVEYGTQANHKRIAVSSVHRAKKLNMTWIGAH